MKAPLPEARGGFRWSAPALRTTAADFGSRWSSDAGFVGDERVEKVDARDLWTAPEAYAESQPPSFVLKTPLAGRTARLEVAHLPWQAWQEVAGGVVKLPVLGFSVATFLFFLACCRDLVRRERNLAHFPGNRTLPARTFRHCLSSVVLPLLCLCQHTKHWLLFKVVLRKALLRCNVLFFF